MGVGVGIRGIGVELRKLVDSDVEKELSNVEVAEMTL